METPLGQSAVSAGQAKSSAMGEDAPRTQTGTPVPGATPVGESTLTAPPADDPVDPAAVVKRHVTAMRNLALLARQAISNSYEKMSVDPKMIADACVVFEEKLGDSNESTLTPITVPDATAALATNDASSINLFRGSAQSLATMIGGPVEIWEKEGAVVCLPESQVGGIAVEGWRRLYTALPPKADEAPLIEDEFKGPGQS